MGCRAMFFPFRSFLRVQIFVPGLTSGNECLQVGYYQLEYDGLFFFLSQYEAGIWNLELQDRKSVV